MSIYVDFECEMYESYSDMNFFSTSKYESTLPFFVHF